MASQRHRELHQTVRERAHRSYRTAFRDDDSWEVIHVREDLRIESLREQIPAVCRALRERRALVRESEYKSIGEAQATSEIHEAGVILHFPEDETEGTVVSLGHDATRQLSSFVAACQAILDPSSESERGQSRTEE